MARGDVVSAFGDDIAVGSSLTYQPAAGVEALITNHSLATTAGGDYSQATGDMGVAITDGTLIAFQTIEGPGHTTRMGHPQSHKYKVFVNNTRYFSLRNNSAASKDLGFSGVQTK